MPLLSLAVLFNALSTTHTRGGGVSSRTVCELMEAINLKSNHSKEVLKRWQWRWPRNGGKGCWWTYWLIQRYMVRGGWWCDISGEGDGIHSKWHGFIWLSHSVGVSVTRPAAAPVSTESGCHLRCPRFHTGGGGAECGVWIHFVVGIWPSRKTETIPNKRTNCEDAVRSWPTYCGCWGSWRGFSLEERGSGGLRESTESAWHSCELFE